MIIQEKEPTKAAKNSALPALPQVDLLPPEVRDGRRLGTRKRMLFYGVLGVILLTILIVAAVYLMKISAESRLEDAQARAAALAAEKRQYSAVTGVIRSIDETRGARDYMLSTEINWAEYIDAIAAELPPGVSIENFEIVQASPTARAPMASDPTLRTGLGTISFTILSDTLPDASDWADALNLIPGFQDASIQVATLNESGADDDSDTEQYVLEATVQLNEEALANRTFEDRDVDADESSDDQSVDTEDEEDNS